MHLFDDEDPDDDEELDEEEPTPDPGLARDRLNEELSRAIRAFRQGATRHWCLDEDLEDGGKLTGDLVFEGDRRGSFTVRVTAFFGDEEDSRADITCDVNLTSLGSAVGLRVESIPHQHDAGLLLQFSC